MAELIKVLVVDDSAFVRKVVTQMLARSPAIEVVGGARDGAEALELVDRLKPDVITLDLIMPRMDGLEFLRKQMSTRPLPVVICSIAHESGEMAIAAFDAGAVEFVQKPTALATDRVFEIADELVGKVTAASQVRMSQLARTRDGAPVVVKPVKRAKPTQTEVVVIGISTGGPQALRQLIPALPADLPVPVAIVLHMPIGYTEMYAQRLNSLSQLDVREARDGDLLHPGVVLLAPAGKHLTFARSADGSVRARLDLRPFDTPHRPSVDVLFRSAADVYGAGVLALVMTGMGNDGLQGSRHVRAQGGRIVTEAESSCVVYGMPRSIVEADLSDRQVALDSMGATLLELL
jgi:two-component system, chemotaxis family, protein-glutamate methylesterase/glutaminase